MWSLGPPALSHGMWKSLEGSAREQQDQMVGWGEAGGGEVSEVRGTRMGKPEVGLEETGPAVGGAAGERQALAQGSTASGQHTAELFRSPHGSLAAAIHVEWVRNRGSDLESHLGPLSRKKRSWDPRPSEQQWKGQPLASPFPSLDLCVLPRGMGEGTVGDDTGSATLEF